MMKYGSLETTESAADKCTSVSETSSQQIPSSAMQAKVAAVSGNSGTQATANTNAGPSALMSDDNQS